MKILILNGTIRDEHPLFDEYLNRLMGTLISFKHEAMQITLYNKKINQCIGCWDCWVKTPGICRQRDDMKEILQYAIRSDLLLFASPLRLGFPSPQLKRTQERMIPLIHPYMEVVNGEVHHRGRYKKYPRIGALFHYPEETGSERNQEISGEQAEDLDILKEIFSRDAVNFKSRLALFATTKKEAQELAYEMHSIQRFT